MKPILATFFLSAFLMASASAQFDGPSGSRQITTVQQAQKARRGQAVTLEGFVVKHLRDRYYLFQDITGEMRVRIDRHRWRNRRVTSKTRVQLIGKIDREVRELYVNVGRLEVWE
jgi:uncharacterized protein (TIGR00156 family)